MQAIGLAGVDRTALAVETSPAVAAETAMPLVAGREDRRDTTGQVRAPAATVVHRAWDLAAEADSAAVAAAVAVAVGDAGSAVSGA